MAVADAPLMMAHEGEDGDELRQKLREIAEAVAKKPTLPPWLLPLVMYLVGQLVGSVWWAATMQSNVGYLQQENMKLWQKVETHDLQLGKMDNMIRQAVKEAMQDADYVRVGRERKGD